MIKDRPILHGMHLNKEYREPYYIKLGLKDFIRKYEAHNQYIQTAANSGIPGLLIPRVALVSSYDVI